MSELAEVMRAAAEERIKAKKPDLPGESEAHFQPDPVVEVTPEAAQEPENASFSLSDPDTEAAKVYKRRKKPEVIETPLEVQDETPAEPVQVGDDDLSYKGDNEAKKNDWNRIKQAADAAKQEASETRLAKQELEAKLAVMEEDNKILQAKLSSMGDLAALENVVLFENSPEFKTAYVDRQEAAIVKARKVAEMNEIDADFVNETISNSTYKEAVVFLTDNIADVSAIADLKPLLQEYYLIEEEKKEALSSPDRFRAVVGDKFKKEREAKTQEARSIANAQVKKAFDIIEEIKTDDNAGLLSSAKNDVTNLVVGLVDEGVALTPKVIETFSKVFSRAYLYFDLQAEIEDLKEELKDYRKKASFANPSTVVTTSSAPKQVGVDRNALFNSFASKIIK